VKIGPFLPRDAMHNCGLWRRPVSASVSVTLTHCVKTSRHILKLMGTP